MTLDAQRNARALSPIRAWANQKIHDSMGPWKGLFNKKPSRAAPTGADLERIVAATIVPRNVWGALRQVGLEPNNLPAAQRDPMLEDIAVRWSRQLAQEISGLNPNDTTRLEMRVRLEWIERSSVFTQENSVRAAIERYQSDGDIWHLESAARAARRGLGAAGRWAATIDLARPIVGESDPKVRELENRLQKDAAELNSTLERALPLLQQHGLADGIEPTS